MLDDKERWNQKYMTCSMPTHVTSIVAQFAPQSKVGKGLDIACGTGRHTRFLVALGFEVDAVDVSDYALGRIADHPRIKKIEADLEDYVLPENRYDIIINCNYLDRNMFKHIEAALKPEGMLIFETFLAAVGEDYHQPSNPDFVLRDHELPEVFHEIETIYYDEREDVNMRGEKVRIASFVAKKVNR